MSSALRFVVHGLLATLLYTAYRFYTPDTGSVLDHPSSGSLGSGVVLSDGRQSLHRRTVAVADLHGDLQHALNVLSMASLISGSGDSIAWTGGHDVLVSTGDIVDRGDDTIALYRLFQTLRSQAATAGGKVVNLKGNHELMNALGDWRYVTEGDVKSFGGVQARREAMSVHGWIGKEWLEHYNVTAVVPLLPTDHPALPKGYTPPKASFVHGGITPLYAARGVDAINTIGKSLLHKALSSTSHSWLPPDVTPEERELWSENGPLWYRGYATNPPEEACPDADAARASLGVQQLIMGHTPHFDGFVSRCNDSVLLIDTGISRAYGGEQSALIIDTDLTPFPDHKGQWIEEQTLTALYKGRKPKILTSSKRHIHL
ncbi:uncharacterized protein PSANT_03339 [Moesziomyces antarcticus]|nr:uncharacterized protein PSANT_03339 [Moesziomyces antarcticus]